MAVDQLSSTESLRLSSMTVPREERRRAPLASAYWLESQRGSVGVETVQSLKVAEPKLYTTLPPERPPTKTQSVKVPVALPR